MTALRLVTFGTRGTGFTDVGLAEVISAVEAGAMSHVAHVDTRGERFGPSLPDPATPAGHEVLAAAGADLFVSIGYLRVLRPATLARARIGAINVHPSLLPAYRGLQSVRWALYEGAREVGVTVHEITDRVDVGDILVQEALVVDPASPPADVHAAVCGAARRALRQALATIRESGQVSGTPQPDGGCYRSRAAKELHRLELDWSQAAPELVRRGRLFPGDVNVRLGGRRVHVGRVLLAGPGAPGSAPGTVLRRRVQGVDVAVREGAVRLSGLRTPGPTKASTALRSVALGRRLPTPLPGAGDV